MDDGASETKDSGGGRGQMSHKIITISREFGSGGLEIATKLAEKLNVPVYNKNITDMASERSGIRKSYEQGKAGGRDDILYDLSCRDNRRNRGVIWTAGKYGAAPATGSYRR